MSANDLSADRARWNARYGAGRGPRQVNPRLREYRDRLRSGRVLDLAGGIGQNAILFAGSTVILVDLSDAALALASGLRVLADANALPFAPGTFDSIVCTYFFEPRVDLAALLVPGGTLFFETYTLDDDRYRPDLNPAHRFDPAARMQVFRGLKELLWQECDDGTRVYGTFIGRKPTATGDDAVSGPPSDVAD